MVRRFSTFSRPVRCGPLARKRRALTLVEALLASVVLVVVVAAVSQALLAGQMQTYDAVHRERAIALGEALMDEIVRLPYADEDADGEASRANFDDLDDYNGFSESGTLTDLEGTALPSAYNDFTRSATVTSSSQTVAGFGAAIDGLEIVVTVTDGTGATWVLKQFIPEPAS